MYAEVDQYEHMMSLLFTLGLGDEPTQARSRTADCLATYSRLPRYLSERASLLTREGLAT
eukprot:3044183-Pleurochrysis_carterae.AAC.3